MSGLWDPSAFADVQDYKSWEARLLEDKDIVRHIEAGSFVPINVGSDGAFEIEVRVGTGARPAVLSDRERKYLTVASEPYRFRSTGSLRVSGIEYVGRPPSREVGVLSLAAGEYVVTLHLIAWDKEPGMKDADGKPTSGALPDFVALVNPRSHDASTFRTSVRTFSPAP